jgi:hypothetical protein
MIVKNKTKVYPKIGGKFEFRSISTQNIQWHGHIY